ncbi:hypothetical protein A2U01_0102531, partial [Trifolium medium]|nr:hypothetical protein [Trifolium medium]
MVWRNSSSFTKTGREADVTVVEGGEVATGGARTNQSSTVAENSNTGPTLAELSVNVQNLPH